MTLRHFLKDSDLSQAEQAEVLNLALKVKANRLGHQVLAGPKSVAVLFDKHSTRTRVSFAVGIAELGGYPLVLDAAGSQSSRGESVEDTTMVLDRQVEAIVWRTFGQDRVEAMAKVSQVPVVNALTDEFHPCQVLADLMTTAEVLGGVEHLPGTKLAYLGDGGNNMAHSYLLGGAVAGMEIAIGCPPGRLPNGDILAQAQAVAASTGASLVVTNSPDEALAGAKVVATDTWQSMGMADDAARLAAYEPYRVDQAAMDKAASGAVFLHCLPAYRGQEVTGEVIDGPASYVWQEAENRLHAQKALLIWLLAGGASQ
ncbi:MAG: ornithine carbamoyltransferase [Micrococcales bacterium]|nr:ornithine carbamoyltransferase [Micrococcales bacterium]